MSLIGMTGLHIWLPLCNVTHWDDRTTYLMTELHTWLPQWGHPLHIWSPVTSHDYRTTSVVASSPLRRVYTYIYTYIYTCIWHEYIHKYVCYFNCDRTTCLCAMHVKYMYIYMWHVHTQTLHVFEMYVILIVTGLHVCAPARLCNVCIHAHIHIYIYIYLTCIYTQICMLFELWQDYIFVHQLASASLNKRAQTRTNQNATTPPLALEPGKISLQSLLSVLCQMTI